MNCYNCGCRLSHHDFCTACGADVGLYKRIMNISNLYYNEGLEKATVRDLTGAVTSLRQSLKFNKNNIDARNLLGLVYFEMGEVVAALSEWVISKNMRPQKNVADDYIEMVQSNASRLESINSTIKKYNQALVYCNQDSKDLAIIQLKKVLSLNPKFVRAHQLLALLYIDSEQWDKAKRELVKCCNIDSNNTQTLRYMKIVDAVLEPDEGVRGDGKRKNEEAVRYQSDNEIIIQPLNVKEQKRSGIGTLFNLVIGFVIGLAAMYFLVLPASITAEKEKANEQVKEISAQLDVKTSTIAELEIERDDLEQQITLLQNELEGYVGEGGTLKVFDGLMDAAKGYVETGDALATASYLEEIEQTIDISQTSAAFQELYAALFTKIGPAVSAHYYDIGYEAYRNELYDDAIANLLLAVKYDAANRDALFNLGNAYKRNEDKENALIIYQQVIDLFPDTQSASRAKRYIDELNAE
ncbi:MAG: tetratricopeptide repeat protein [Lachnospiraceae bacterium]|nr:tetratricopeptide repeat protein [Lachnospiraceae bacterium]